MRRPCLVASILGLMLNLGCREGDTPRFDTHLLLSQAAAMEADDGVAMQVELVTDTIEIGQAPHLWVLLTNYGPPRMVSNDPMEHFFEILTEAGDTVDPSGLTSAHYFRVPESRFVLPTNSVFAQFVDLRCVPDPYAAADDDFCHYSFVLRSAGRYRLVSKYMIPPTVEGLEFEVLVDTTQFVVLR